MLTAWMASVSPQPETGSPIAVVVTAMVPARASDVAVNIPNASIANCNCRIHAVFRSANAVGRAETQAIEPILFAFTLTTIGLLLFDMFSSCWTRELGMSVDGRRCSPTRNAHPPSRTPSNRANDVHYQGTQSRASAFT
jgi:hypothetical protein